MLKRDLLSIKGRAHLLHRCLTKYIFRLRDLQATTGLGTKLLKDEDNLASY